MIRINRFFSVDERPALQKQILKLLREKSSSLIIEKNYDLSVSTCVEREDKREKLAKIIAEIEGNV